MKKAIKKSKEYKKMLKNLGRINRQMDSIGILMDGMQDKLMETNDKIESKLISIGKTAFEIANYARILAEEEK